MSTSHPERISLDPRARGWVIHLSAIAPDNTGRALTLSPSTVHRAWSPGASSSRRAGAEWNCHSHKATACGRDVTGDDLGG